MALAPEAIELLCPFCAQHILEPVIQRDFGIFAARAVETWVRVHTREACILRVLVHVQVKKHSLSSTKAARWTVHSRRRTYGFRQNRGRKIGSLATRWNRSTHRSWASHSLQLHHHFFFRPSTPPQFTPASFGPLHRDLLLFYERLSFL